MAHRSKERKRALDILYAAEARDVDPVDLLAERRADDAPIGDYAELLVRGVAENLSRVDELIEHYAQEWTLQRMPAVDRGLLRIAVFELIGTDTPPAVAVDEAVESAKALSTDNSPKFINGVLGQLVSLVGHLRG